MSPLLDCLSRPEVDVAMESWLWMEALRLTTLGLEARLGCVEELGGWGKAGCIEGSGCGEGVSSLSTDRIVPRKRFITVLF